QDFHGANLGSAGDRAAGEASVQQIERVQSLLQSAVDRRGEMVNLRKGLELAQPGHRDRASLAHPAEVVAQHVDDHDVFRSVLGAGYELESELGIGGGI